MKAPDRSNMQGSFHRPEFVGWANETELSCEKRFDARFRRRKGVRAAMQHDRFDVPLTVKLGDTGNHQILKTVQEASDFLLNNWPGKRSPKHRAALQACHDAIAGNKPIMAARRAFIAAAREADVLVSDKAPG